MRLGDEEAVERDKFYESSAACPGYLSLVINPRITNHE
jgi:hypothetical protein